MKYTLLFQLSLILPGIIVKAQQTCQVKLKEIQGTYIGDCTNNKANGNGKAVGIDSYEGEFKNGYPDGKGMYTWKDGHYFIGFYNKGEKEGKGDMYYESTTGEDSVISGYWKKDKYTGEYAKKFEVISFSSRINKVECTLKEKTGNYLSIELKRRGGPTLPTSTAPPEHISSITTLDGTYDIKSEKGLLFSSTTTIQVTFPFKETFYFTNGEYMQVLFNEKGNYDVFVAMQ